VAVGEEGSRIAEGADDLYSRAQAAFGLGMLYLLQGRSAQAIDVLEEGLVIARLATIPFMVPFVTGPLGAAYTQAGQVERGIALLEQTVEQCEAIGLAAQQALLLIWLGTAQVRAGRAEAARGLARRALEVAEERQERGHVAHALCLLGDSAAMGPAPDPAGAADAHGRGLVLAESLGMAPLAARCQLALGEIDVQTGQAERGRQRLAAAAAAFQAMEMTSWLARAEAIADTLRPA
jgi:tetratricopeptide (TPR) repeat protein